jgi:hypothetical protein
MRALEEGRWRTELLGDWPEMDRQFERLLLGSVASGRTIESMWKSGRAV